MTMQALMDLSPSEYVTWARCPRCGNRAAVGWASSPSSDARAQVPVEFDCLAGCLLPPEQLVRLF